uniref:Uncharacterized protein n=1 Tax=Arundo donax TaxID=35708 RepID=A0A0A9FV39_ARUDO
MSQIHYIPLTCIDSEE